VTPTKIYAWLWGPYVYNPLYDDYSDNYFTISDVTNPTINITSNPNTIILGESSVVSWTATSEKICSNIVSCTNTQTICSSNFFGISSSESLSGSRTVIPKTIGIIPFSLICKGVNGTLVQATTTISVDPVPSPSVTVISPNGGEELRIGKMYEIKWDGRNFPADNMVGIALVNEATVNTYLHDLTNYLFDNKITTGSVSWTVPDTITPGKYRLRMFCGINGTDRYCSEDGSLDSNPQSQDYSDSFFTITSTPPTSCYNFSVNLQIGSRGDDVTALQKFLIAKGFSISEGVTGYFSYGTFTALTKYQRSVGLPATGFFGPLTRAKVNKDCQSTPVINISWSNGTDKVLVGLVDSRFEKDGTVLGWILLDQKPNGSFAWNGQSISDLSGKVSWPPLSLSSGPFRIIAVTAGSGKNYCLDYKPECSIVLSEYFNISNEKIDIRLEPFISNQNYVTVTNPSAGEVLQTGFQYKIIWTTNSLDKDQLFDITEFSDSGKSLIAEGVTTMNCTQVVYVRPGENKYTCITDWIPKQVSSKSRLVVSKRGTNEVGYSGSFSVVSKTGTGPSITVLSPNGGESWTRGTTQTIKWNDNTPIPACPTGAYCTQPAPKSYDVKLAPYYPPCTGRVCPAYPYIAPYPIAIGISKPSYEWNVGLTKGDVTAPDGSYKVQICQTGTNTCDFSDSFFTIDSRTIKPSISITSPNGGEVWYGNNSYQLRWRSVNMPNDGYLRALLIARDGSTFDSLVNKSSPGEICVIATEANKSCVSINSGSVTIPILDGWITPGEYKVRIGCFKMNSQIPCTNYFGETGDESDSYFTIASEISTNPPPTPIPTPTPTPVNLITSFTQGTAYSYDNFTKSGNSITSAVESSANIGGAISNRLTLDTSKKYKLTYTLNLNSGTAPNIRFVSGSDGRSSIYLTASNTRALDQIAQNGTNSVTFTPSKTNGYIEISVGSGSKTDFSMSNISLEEVGPSAQSVSFTALVFEAIEKWLGR